MSIRAVLAAICFSIGAAGTVGGIFLLMGLSHYDAGLGAFVVLCVSAMLGSLAVKASEGPRR